MRKTADMNDLMPLKQDLEAISAAMLNANDHITELLVKLNEMTGETPEEEMPPPEAGPEEGEGEGEGMPETEGNVEEAIDNQEEEAGAPKAEGEAPTKASSRQVSSKEIIGKIEPQIARLMGRLPEGYEWHVGGGVAGIIKRLDAKNQFSIRRAPTERISFLVTRKK